MARSNSIALGKTRGSIGNVTFARLKGQQIAKSKVEPTGAIAPELQSPSQKRMKAIVMAWQVISNFLVFTYGLRKPVESTYNAFVRLFKSFIQDSVYTSGWAVLEAMNGYRPVGGNLPTIEDISSSAVSATVTFNSTGVAFINGTRLRILRYDASTGANGIHDVEVTEAEWAAGTLVNPFPFIDVNTAGAYLYVPGTKKCSMPFFVA